MTASGLSSFMWPPVAELLLRNYGLSGTLMIFAAIQSHSCVFGALLRPLESKKDKSDEKLNKMPNNTMSQESCDDRYSAENQTSDVVLTVTNSGISGIKDEVVWKESETGSKSDASTEKKPPHGPIFRNRHSLVYSVGITIAYFGYSLEYLYLPGIAVQLGSTAKQGAFLASTFGEKYYFESDSTI